MGSGLRGSESAAKRKQQQQTLALEQLLWGPTGGRGSGSGSGEEESTSTTSGSVRPGGGVSSLQVLLQMRRLCGGAGGGGMSGLDEEGFLDKWARGHAGCLLLRAVVVVDAKQKKVEVILDQPGFRRGQVSGRFAYKDKVNS